MPSLNAHHRAAQAGDPANSVACARALSLACSVAQSNLSSSVVICIAANKHCLALQLHFSSPQPFRPETRLTPFVKEAQQVCLVQQLGQA